MAWCEPQGEPLCAMDSEQRVLAFDVLSAALSPGGLQTVLAVMNRQRIMVGQCHSLTPG